jgi:acyl-CoA thioesterase-2
MARHSPHLRFTLTTHLLPPQCPGMQYPPTPEQLVADLVLLLDMEPRGAGRFEGRRRKGGVGRVYGGQVIAQALAAAERTVPEDRAAHSLHAYFLRGGTEDLPIDYAIMRDFEGRSFSNRRVVATQQGEPILNLTASFQVPGTGLSHQNAAIGDVPQPEELESDNVVSRRYDDTVSFPHQTKIGMPGPIDYRSVEAARWLESGKAPPIAHTWFRTVAPLPDDPRVHRAVLAYASDIKLLGTAIFPHDYRWGDLSTVKPASLDHAIWFHEPFRADEWLLYVTESPWAGHARGFASGRVFSRDGRLVASVTQEGAIRVVGNES